MSTVASSEASKAESKPPRPPLILHVGVLGHRPVPEKRPMPDVDALRSVIRDILQRIQDAVAGLASAHGDIFSLDQTGDHAGGIVRVISSLAEGADQWVADEALRLGYELQTPMPFGGDEYAKDFQGSALTEFNRLKDQASAILELDGCRNRKRESYEAAGRLVIGQSDLIIAIWDGLDEKGRGGTAQMVRESLRNGVPVVWIKWAAPEQWQLLDTSQWRVLQNADELKGEFTRLTALINDILIPPDLKAIQKQRTQTNGRERYFNETKRQWNVLGCMWRLLRWLVLFKNPKCVWRLPSYLAKTNEDWQKEWKKPSKFNKSLVDWIDKPYLVHYAWANRSALFYGDLHRSYTALNYILGTLAVLCALLGIPSLVNGHRETAAILLELASIGLIIFLTLRGAIGHWHERWIQYRILAERLRIARFLDLLGGGRQHFTLPAHLGTYGNPADTWVYWHYRSVSRSAGLPNIQFSSAFLQSVQAAWRDILIESQIEYHKNNEHDLSTVDHRLHWLANSLFGVTFIVCAIHFSLVNAMKHVPIWAAILLITLNALLPAFGAAVAAIRNQGEFHRIAQRSRAMYEELVDLKLLLSQIAPRGEELKSLEIRRVIEQVARLMINETLDWRIVFQDRPLALPA